MNIVQRTLVLMNSYLKSYGPSNIKKLLWDKEFSGSKWNFIDNTAGDCIYPHLEKHAANGSILDLGCGPGNTANELDITAYRSYIGVDISEAALAKAAKRSEGNGRADKNLFVQSDFLKYQPTHQFDVIVFRESIYHVPLGQIRVILDKYSKYLSDRGVFIVRLDVLDGKKGQIKKRPKAMMEVIETEFDILEKQRYPGEFGPTVMVFRPCRPR
jgi:SAM-dependent methyltransferase